MRQELVALQKAKMRCTRFSAIFSGVSRKGHIILSDVRGPFGISGHLWVCFHDWPGRMPMPDSEIVFSASVRTYERRDNTTDLQLCRIKGLEVLR